jgi:hypothetical protein
MIQLAHGSSDDAGFIHLVTRTAEIVVKRYPPSALYVLRINNWFDAKWVGFSGKVLGAVPFWQRDVTLPPFVPNRVESQQYWEHDSGKFISIDAIKPLHRRQPSNSNLQRRLADVAPGASFIWYSGKTAANSRGSMMVYIADRDSYWTWYAGLKKADEWRPILLKGIAEAEFASFWAAESA